MRHEKVRLPAADAECGGVEQGLPGLGPDPKLGSPASGSARGKVRLPAADAECGFTIAEAAVAIAVVAILSGMMAPMALKFINQQRESRTRQILQAAFEGMFGSREYRVSNMRADFGWNPTTSLTDLRALTQKASSGVTTDYGGSGVNGIYFFWGWNGPYYQGTVNTNGAPLDGWGKVIRLNCTTQDGLNYWQLQSSGQDQAFGTTDDLVYPTQRASANSYNATIIVNVHKVKATNFTGRITFRYLNGTDTLPSAVFAINNTSSVESYTGFMSAGGVQAWLEPLSPGNFVQVRFVADLLPGETKTYDITI